METLVDLKAYWSILGAELAKQAKTIPAETLEEAKRAQAVYIEWAKATAGRAVVRAELETQGRLYNAVLVQLALVGAQRMPPAFDLSKPMPRPTAASSSSEGWGIGAAIAIGAGLFILTRRGRG